MKFSTPILALFLAATALASPVKRDNKEECKRAIQNAGCSILNVNVKDDRIVKHCGLYNNKACKKIHKKGIKSIKGCENLSSSELEKYQEKVNSVFTRLEKKCPRDSKGKITAPTVTVKKPTSSTSTKKTKTNSTSTSTKKSKTSTTKKSKTSKKSSSTSSTAQAAAQTPAAAATQAITQAPVGAATATATNPIGTATSSVLMPTTGTTNQNIVSGASTTKYTSAILVSVGAFLFTLF